MANATFLATLPAWAFAFSVVLARTGVFVMLVPGLGELELPQTVKAGVALALTFLLTPILGPVASPDHAISAAGMIAAECLVGGMLGWLARLPVMALSLTGAFISYMLGLSSVVQFDPALGGQSSALARLFGLAAPVLILNGTMLFIPLSALAGSYQVFSPGSIVPSDALAESVSAAVVSCLSLSLRLSTPFLTATLLLQTTLAIMARLVPQLQLYTAALPGQILGGLALLGLIASSLFLQWGGAVHEAWLRLPGL